MPASHLPLNLPVPFKLLLCAALFALLAACGDDQQDTAPGEQASPMADQTAPADGDDKAGEAAEPAAEMEQAAADNEPAAGESATATDAKPETHTVNARATAFDPVAIRINPGDSVRWTNMGGHNVNFEAGLIPEGAEPYTSSLGDNISRTYDREGIYLYKCDPHFAMGMVGAIIVGEPVNMEAIEENARGMYKRALSRAKAAIE